MKQSVAILIFRVLSVVSEVVPYPYLVNVSDLPEAVGETYTGSTLFTQDSSGNYAANYTESLNILESLFLVTKIFFSCVEVAVTLA